MATSDPSSGSSHRCRIMSGSSTTLMTPTMTHAKMYGLRVGIVGGVWVWKSRYGDGITFGCFLVSLFSSSLLWISARYKWHWHGFYDLRISVNGRWSFAVHRIHRKVTLSGTDRLWDLWVLTIAYVERLFDYFLPFISFPTLVRDYAAQEICT
jgi:hypothetical protein